MTATAPQPVARPRRAAASSEEGAAMELVRLAHERGVALVGPSGLLDQALESVGERSGQQGKAGAGDGRPYLPLPSVEALTELVLSLSARGLSNGQITAHFAEIYGAPLSAEAIAKIMDSVVEEMQDWASRPLDSVYAAIFIDAIVVKIRDGHVANRPVYAAIGVTLEGEKDILGLWVGSGGEGAKFWLSVLTDIKNRGVRDTFFLVCDGLKGLPDAVEAVWPLATVQTCVIHLVRNTFRLVARNDWDAVKRDLRPIYAAPTEAAARAALDALTSEWGDRYPALGRLWDAAWEQFIPFLDYDAEIRTIIYSTNAIESLNSRYRRAVRVRGHFQSDQAALRCLYLVTRSLDPTGTGRTRWATRWKPALNAFAIRFADRWPGVDIY